MNDLSRTLDAIKAAVAEMQKAVTETQSSSQEISKIIKVIDEIAPHLRAGSSAPP